MIKNEPFSSKKLVPSSDLERGDIIFYKPINSTELQRAIFYRPFYDSLGATVGILCLPLNTVGKKKVIDSKDPVMETTSVEQVLQAGANPSMQRAYVDLHLRTVVADPKMTTTPKNREFYKIGSYHGLPFMTTLLNKVQRLFEEEKLFKDGKLLKPVESRYITAPQITAAETKAVRVARAKAHAEMDTNADAGKTTPLATKMPSTSGLSLREAFDKKMIEGRTVLVLLTHSLKTGYFPETLGAAYALVTQHGKELCALDNPVLEKDDVKNAIDDIKAAARSFTR